MPDNVLNITVQTDSKTLQDLINKLNSGALSVKDFAKAAREVKNELVIGSQAQKDFGDMMNQVSVQTKSVLAQQNSLIGVMKTARQERRLGMFAVTEFMRATEGLTGKDNEMSKAIMGSTQAFFGMKFALDAMGGGLATLSTPLSLLIASFTFIKGLLKDIKDYAKEATEEGLKRFGEAFGLLSPFGKTGTTTEIDKRLKEMYAQRNQFLNQEREFALLGTVGGKTATVSPTNTPEFKALEANIKLYEGMREQAEEIRKREEARKSVMEAVNKTIEAGSSDYQKLKKELEDVGNALTNQNMSLEARQKLVDYQERLQLKIADMEKSTATREDERKKLAEENKKSAEEELRIRQRIADIVHDIQQEEIKAFDKGFDYLKLQQEVHPQTTDEYIKQLRLLQESTKDEKLKLEIEKEIQSTAERASQSMQRGLTAIEQGLSSIGIRTDSWIMKLSKAVQYALEFKAILKASESTGDFEFYGGLASKVLGVLGLALAGGGDVTTGGRLQFAASGVNIPYGSNWTGLVGDDNGRINRTTELMQVGKNGVRIISNNNLRQLNQMGQSSRGGGNNIILRPQFITQTVAGYDGIYTGIKMAEQRRPGRTI